MRDSVPDYVTAIYLRINELRHLDLVEVIQEDYDFSERLWKTKAVVLVEMRTHA